MATEPNDAKADKMVQEMRRGVVVLAVLHQLKQAHYGYSLRLELAQRGFDVNEGTLYPLLRRLEKQKLLQSRWEIGNGRPRRYYSLSPAGHALYLALKAEWKYLGQTMAQVLSEIEL